MSLLPSRAQTLFRDLPWADAAHAAIVSAAPAIMAVLSGEPRLGWSAIAAFWACFADPGGPLAQRLRAMCWVAGVGALFCFLGSAAKDTLWLLLPLTFVCCTLASFAQAWGPAAAVIGTLVSAGFVVSTELPTPTVASSAAYAAFFVGGGVWAIVMTALVWRRRPWRHATVAVAACYAEVAEYARALGLLYLPSSARRMHTGQSSEISTVHRKAMRGLIDRARKRITEIQSSRPSRMTRARQLTALLDASERAFIVLVALADTMASLADVDDVPPLATQRLRDASILRALHRFAQACEVTASISDIDDPVQRQRLNTALARTDQAVRQAHTAVLPGDAVMPTLLPLLDSLFSAGADSVSALVTGASPMSSINDHPDELARIAQTTGLAAAWRIGWRQLRQSLDLQSGITRHAIRVGVAATTSVALCRIFDINHGYWMSLTVVFILQPFLASTWQRTAERIAGSVLGAVGASAVGILLPSPLAVGIAVLPIAIGTFVGRTIHYAIFTFFLTLQFVLVAEIQQPASHEFTLAALRATNSVYGGILALLIGILLWPERSQQRLATVLAEAVERHAAYVQQVLRAVQGDAVGGGVGGAVSNGVSDAVSNRVGSAGSTAVSAASSSEAADEVAVKATTEAVLGSLPGSSASESVAPSSATLGSLRRDACLSADNAQTVLQGLLRSPLHRRQNAAAVSSLIASLRGMTAAATVLELQPLKSTVPQDQLVAAKQIARYAKGVALSMHDLAVRIREHAASTSRVTGDADDLPDVLPKTTPNAANVKTAGDVTPPAALLHPTDPRSLALQRISTIVTQISAYPGQAR